MLIGSESPNAKTNTLRYNNANASTNKGHFSLLQIAWPGQEAQGRKLRTGKGRDGERSWTLAQSETSKIRKETMKLHASHGAL
jgi:hypothetical protein